MEQGLRLITEDKDVVYMCEIHAAWLTDRIKLYVEGVEEPFVVVELGQNAEVNEGVMGQNDDDVHEVREGNVNAKGGDDVVDESNVYKNV